MAPDGDKALDARIWGKCRGLDRPYPLGWHLADAAAVAMALWERYLSAGQRATIARGIGSDGKDARSLLGLLAGLHDLGKVTPSFQRQDMAAFESLAGDGEYAVGVADVSFRHEVASQLLLVNLLEGVGYSTSPWRSSTAYRCAQILGGHHGRFSSSPPEACQFVLERYPAVGDGKWQVQRRLLFEAMFAVLGQPAPPRRMSVDAAVLITGVVILADWLVSQERFLRRRQTTVEPDVTLGALRRHLSATATLAPDVLSEAGLGRIRYRDRPFLELFGVPPNPLQRSILDEFTRRVTGPGLLVATAATGDGKTETALTAARTLGRLSGADGLYFALPTMATADQMHLRVEQYARRGVSGPAMLTLLHSMAWLGADPRAGLGDAARQTVSDDAGDERSVAATRWLRGRHRGLLANLTVGTIDQALLAVLRARYSALRMLGLSSKVFVVDEAHAYDPYMRALIGRLLAWLGRLGCPTVLLSATLPSSVAREMFAAYAAGAGRSMPDALTVRYPGWAFLPAGADQEPVHISEAARRQVIEHRRIDLTVDVRPVQSRSRAAAVCAELAGLLHERGCAAIVCNTVADAQDTYRQLADWLVGSPDPPELHLLHARMPVGDRMARTEKLITRYAKGGSRPSGIVVATQVIEQSLDLDFDLLISDLAPIALLVQRAGRCQRHLFTTRPSWAPDPRLVVLDPVDTAGRFVPPKRWGSVYPRYLLRATHHVLVHRIDPVVRIPDHVEDLVETVYERAPESVPGLANDADAAGEYAEYGGTTVAERGLAEMGAVPEPGRVPQLGVLHDAGIAEVDIATRSGAGSVRTLPCFVDTTNGRWLDAACTIALPEKGSGPHGRYIDEQVRLVLSHTVPLRADQVVGAGDQHQPPDSWSDSLWLREVILLPHHVDGATVSPATIGNRTFELDDQLGLVITSPGRSRDE